MSRNATATPDIATSRTVRGGGGRAGTARLVGSTAVILCVLLIAANYAFTRFDATALVPIAQMTPQESAVRAVSFKMRALESRRAAPDVLVVGSSLPMSALCYADAKHYKPEMDKFLKEAEKEKVNAFQAYPDALYLSRLLSDARGRETSVFNLTVPACMVSDAAFLMNQAVSRKKPRVIIWGVAPRDFVDNVIPPIGKTPAFAALPSSGYLANVLPFQKDFVAAADSVSAAFVRFYNDRTVWKHLLSGSACSVLHRPGSLMESTAGGVTAAAQSSAAAVPTAPVPRTSSPRASAPAASPKALDPAVVADARKRVATMGKAPQAVTLYNLAGDATTREPGWNHAMVPQCVDYYHRYNPANFPLLESQSKQFARALQFCKQEGIEVVLVDMPLPRKHLTLIDPKLYAAYRAKLSALATAGGANLLDLNHPDKYGCEDWIDSLHLTAAGADKFLPELAGKMRGNMTPQAATLQ